MPPSSPLMDSLRLPALIHEMSQLTIANKDRIDQSVSGKTRSINEWIERGWNWWLSSSTSIDLTIDKRSIKIPFQSGRSVKDFPWISSEFASDLHKNYRAEAIPPHRIHPLWYANETPHLLFNKYLMQFIRAHLNCHYPIKFQFKFNHIQFNPIQYNPIISASIQLNWIELNWIDWFHQDCARISVENPRECWGILENSEESGRIVENLCDWTPSGDVRRWTNRSKGRGEIRRKDPASFAYRGGKGAWRGWSRENKKQPVSSADSQPI